MGIGLTLTKELVELHHGEMTVTSIPEKATTFKVILPVDKLQYKEDEIVKELEAENSRPKTGKKIHLDTQDLSPISDRSEASGLRSPLILIVEDNLDVASYICSILDNDYRIIAAENGKEGLKKALAKYPDLIISDVMMPEMDGFELCRKLKTDERISHIPVILLTAKADLESKIEGLEFGADDYVTKPFEAKELQIRSKNLIEQRRKLREKFSQLIDLKPADISASSMDEQFLKRFMAVFEEHISESDFSTDKIAREVGMSRSNLNRKLKALTNQSTHESIRSLRLKRAAQLLKKATGSVAEIAYQVGYNNTSHFAKAFREQFGLSPAAFSLTNK